MQNKKDYSEASIDELQSELQKLKVQKIPVILGMALLLGLAVYAATHGGGFFRTVLLLSSVVLFGGTYLKKRNKLEAEINRRDRYR
ncbi:MAG: hypothetical protein KGS48_19260 [Bacteroidetes bacterium]|nr:hypothetical protein [Bacteroidota bacterium]